MELQYLFPFIFVGFTVAIIVFAIVFGRRQLQRTRENLARLASKLGLQIVEPPGTNRFLRPPPTLAGMFRGRQLRVYSYTTGSGKSRTQWCALATPLRNPAGLTLRIGRENVFTRVGRAIGIDDVAIGDEAFDREFYVKSNKPGFVRAALIPEVRQRLTQTWAAGARGSVAADATEIKYAEVGAFSNEKTVARFTAVAAMVCELAEVVEACSG